MKWLWICMALLVGMGCEETNAPLQKVEVTPRTDVRDPYGVEHPALDLPPQSRAVKRLTVQQLRESLPQLAGSDAEGEITWKLPFNVEFEALGPAVLAPVLGEPNYVTTTEEPQDVSAMYLKFMDDMSRDVCRRMTLDEYGPNPEEDLVLTRFVDKGDLSDSAGIDANLRYLSLHFLGEFIAEEDAEAIAPLRTLFDKAADFEGQPFERAREGWYSVCVAMLASPSFHLY